MNSQEQADARLRLIAICIPASVSAACVVSVGTVALLFFQLVLS